MAIKVVDIIVERKGKILLTKKGDYWILPGKESEPGEDEMVCLEKIVALEINDQVSSVFRKLEKSVRGPSPVRGGEVEVSTYIGEIGSAKMSEVRNCNAYWFSRESLLSIRLSNITREVLNAYFTEV